MVVASVTFEADGSWRAEVQISETYPDAADDAVSRCLRMVHDVQAQLPEDGGNAEG